jgi:predicted alpha/beta superfamily hydrolase
VAPPRESGHARRRADAAVTCYTRPVMRRLVASPLALTAILLLSACGGDDPPPRTDGGRMDDGGAPIDAGGGMADGAVSDGGTARDAGLRVDGGGPSTPSLDEIVALLRDSSHSPVDVDGALRDVAQGAALPLVEGGRILFVTRWDDAPASVSLVGDVNGWDTAAHPAERAASGAHYFVVAAVAALTGPLEGAKYKWWGAPDVYRAPPEATAYGFDGFGEHGYVRRDPSLATRERFPAFASAHLELPRTVRVLVPAGFIVPPTPSDVRVLVLHDGQNVFHPDAPFGGWRVDEALADPALSDVFAVAVDNAPDRMSAYTHVPDRIDIGAPVGGRADDYLAMLADEVLPFVRARYAVMARGPRTVVMGSSLGGLVSLYLAMRAPSFASCVIAMSPTLGWGAFDPAADGSDALVRRWPAEVGHGPVAIYLDSGGGVTGTCDDVDGDGVDEDADDRDNYCATAQLRDLLDAEGYSFDTDLFHRWQPDAPHNEAAWAARVPTALAACEEAGWTR